MGASGGVQTDLSDSESVSESVDHVSYGNLWLSTRTVAVCMVLPCYHMLLSIPTRNGPTHVHVHVESVRRQRHRATPLSGERRPGPHSHAVAGARWRACVLV